MFDRKKHWGDVYQKKSPSEVSWYQKEPKLSLELIRCTNVASNEAIIDVGGGTSVLVDHLGKEGYTNLTVLDISENAITSAKKRLGDSAKSIEWIVSDITQFDAIQECQVKFSIPASLTVDSNGARKSNGTDGCFFEGKISGVSILGVLFRNSSRASP